MKQVLVNTARKTLPKKVIHSLEQNYRKARVHITSAKYGYPARGLRVIAVTGTNGKTTTISYLNEILKASGYTTAMFSTAEIEMAGKKKVNDLNATVALTAQMQEFLSEAKKNKVQYVLLEATSHALDQHKLDTIPIECAIMTNLTQDHLDYHETMEKYADAKAKLFKSKPRYIVLNRDDQWFDFFNKFEAGEHKITYGTHAESEAKITGVKLYKKGSETNLVIDHQTPLHIGSFLPGKYNVYNYSAAAAAAYVMGISLDAIIEGIAELESIPGRFERIDTKTPYDVIVDYAHTPDALEQLLQTVKEATKNRIILVFGACGDRDKSKRPIMGEIAAKLADRIIVTDEENYNEEPSGIRALILEGINRAGGESRAEEIADREEAIKKALDIARKNDTVLITGMGHEQYRIIDGKKTPWNDGEVVIKLSESIKSRS